jgi:ketosteroid isomerase-like protein
MASNDITNLETNLNALTAQGKILEALEAFYSPDCTFQEGNQPLRVGRAAQHAHLSGFFATLKAFNGATLRASTVGGDVAMAEWTFDMTGPTGPILWNEILVRRWRDGKVISERYYTAA